VCFAGLPALRQRGFAPGQCAAACPEEARLNFCAKKANRCAAPRVGFGHNASLRTDSEERITLSQNQITLEREH
jgi:hypothetical protein